MNRITSEQYGTAHAIETLSSAALSNEAARTLVHSLTESLAVAKDQDWQQEQTRYTYPDNTVLVVSGCSCWAERIVSL